MPSPYFDPSLISGINPGMVSPGAIALTPGAAPAMEMLGDQIYQGPGGSQSYDRFKAEFQARTGDQTADPFAGLGDRNIARMYNQSAADSWSQHQQLLQGRVPAVAGSAMLGPVAPAAQAVAARSAAAPVATLQPGATYGDLDMQGANHSLYVMNHPEETTYTQRTDPIFQAIQRSLGVQQPSVDEMLSMGQQTGHFPKPNRYLSSFDTNRESPTYGVDTTVLNDPVFKRALEVSPIRAARAYEELTGTSYKNVEDLQTSRKKDRESFDDAMVRELANTIRRNPETGELEKYQRVRKSPGMLDKVGTESSVPEYENIPVPLNDVEKKWLASGAFTRKTGISIDEIKAKPLAPPPPEGVDAEQYSKAIQAGYSPEKAREYADYHANKRAIDRPFGQFMKGVGGQIMTSPVTGLMPWDMIRHPIDIGLETVKGTANSIFDLFRLPEGQTSATAGY